MTDAAHDKILLVDDEPRVLEGYQRLLRKQFQLLTAPSGAAALELFAQQGPIAVLVADMRMPTMDGVQLLEIVRQKSPLTVRLMLTGNADQQTAVTAVNRGAIFRFLNKPCTTEQMSEALRAALEQHRLQTAERELLEQTLRGSLKVMTEMLSLLDPEGFGRSTRVRHWLKVLAEPMQLSRVWELDLAAMLGPLGYATVPAEIMTRKRHGAALTRKEQEVLAGAPGVSHHLLSNIPRLGDVARIVLYQDKHFDGTGYPADDVKGEDIPFGSRLLKIVQDLTLLEQRNLPFGGIVKQLRSSSGLYDPDLLGRVLAHVVAEEQTAACEIAVWDVREGYVLATDVCTLDGALLVKRGQVVGPSLKQRLRSYLVTDRIGDKVRVFIPAGAKPRAA